LTRFDLLLLILHCASSVMNAVKYLTSNHSISPQTFGIIMPLNWFFAENLLIWRAAMLWSREISTENFFETVFDELSFRRTINYRFVHFSLSSEEHNLSHSDLSAQSARHCVEFSVCRNVKKFSFLECQKD